MPSVKGTDLLILARLSEYCLDRLPWNRRLWACGSVLVLGEICEASDAVQESSLNRAALSDLQSSAVAIMGSDPGLGSAKSRDFLRRTLKDEIKSQNIGYYTLQQYVEEADRLYLQRWSTHIAAQTDVGIERTARYVATYLLDRGHSRKWLRMWIRQQVFKRKKKTSLVELLMNLHSVSQRPLGNYEALFPVHRAPLAGETQSIAWLPGREVVEWLHRNRVDTTQMRLAGGVRLIVAARDEWAAADRIREMIDRLLSRAQVGTRSSLSHSDQFWIAGVESPFLLGRSSRGVAIRSVEREDRLYDHLEKGFKIDHAIHLAGSLDQAPPGPAIAAGWAAIESLLVEANESGDHVRAADRAAAIVACSFPRAELTTLSYGQSIKKKLAGHLGRNTTNRERSDAVLDFLLNGISLGRVRLEDEAAIRRMQGLLDRPDQVLRRVQQHLARCLRRFYRQRNLVMHGARTEGVAVLAALRTAAPIVGTVLDRIHHAWAKEELEPVALASRAERNLAILNSTDAKPLTALLEQD